MAAVRDVLLRGVLLDLHAHGVATLRHLDWLVVLLNATHIADGDVVLLRNTYGRVEAQLAADHAAAEDKGVALVEDILLVDLHDDGEDGLLPGLRLLRLLHLCHVGRELVKEVVDNVRREDLHVVVLRLVDGLGVDLDVEAKDHSELGLLLLLHDCSLLHVLLVHLADSDVEDWDLHVNQEVEKCLQRAQRARLDIHALRLLLKLSQDTLEAFRHLVFELLDIVVGADNEKLRASNSLVQARGADLHAHGHADLLVVDVLALHSHLLHGLWSEKCADGRHDGPAHASNHDLVAFAKRAVDEDHVDCRAQAFDVLDLDDSALQLLLHLQLGSHLRLREGEQLEQQVRHTFTRERTRWHDRDSAAGVLVLPVESYVQAALVQLQHDIAQALLELVPHKLLLPVKRRADPGVGLGVPLVADVHLVQGDDEGAPALLQHLQRLHRLRLKPVHDVDHKDRHVTQRGTARTEVVEGLVARRINDHDAGHLDVKVGIHLPRLLHERNVREERGANLLGDTSGLTLLHVGAPDLVQ
mmetsp:Transcript_117878/g.313576  ORF Transcript_117878/g.313576 Transcript_117878/m.313576 type:complete len:528 (+) Transcript_117878:396-1979(+)